METTNVRTAVVTGAASGFGRAVADQVASRGAGVAMLDIDRDRVTDAAAEVRTSHGVDAIAARVDVSSREELDLAADAVLDRFGWCDLLWVNVGVQHFGTVESTPEAVWRWMFDVNVVGAVNTVQAFLPLLRHADRSWIAFTASTNALAPAARLGAYQASKCAVVGLAETLRLELAHESIGVSVVYPAGMMTRHLESSAAARPDELGPGDVDPDDLTAMMESRPMTDADLTTAEVAAANAIAGVLAGEPNVITHGDLAGAVSERHAAIDRAVAQLGARQPS
jgi:NAD(P)-dependent dehydrogenase (short-subunit alcohol dehydrogenase family)